LLSDVDALYDTPPSKIAESEDLSTHKIAEVVGLDKISEFATADFVDVAVSSVGTGGMLTKLQSAYIAAKFGIPTYLGNALNVVDVLDDNSAGTKFLP
jgi:glutamate 5-kinase